MEVIAVIDLCSSRYILKGELSLRAEKLWTKSISHHLRNPGMIPSVNTNNKWFPSLGWCRMLSIHSMIGHELLYGCCVQVRNRSNSTPTTLQRWRAVGEAPTGMAWGLCLGVCDFGATLFRLIPRETKRKPGFFGGVPLC